MKYLKILLTLTLLFGSTTIFAAETLCTTGSCTEQPCQQCEDQKTCVSEWIIKKEKKTRYFTECKDICIPKVRFPWEKCCEPKCGKVITVKVLKKKKETREKCTTKWNIFSFGSSCSDNSCAPGRQTLSGKQPSAATNQSPTPPPPAPGEVILNK